MKLSSSPHSSQGIRPSVNTSMGTTWCGPAVVNQCRHTTQHGRCATSIAPESRWEQTVAERGESVEGPGCFERVSVMENESRFGEQEGGVLGYVNHLSTTVTQYPRKST